MPGHAKLHSGTSHTHTPQHPTTPTGSLILTSCVLSEEQVSRFHLLACCLVAWTAGICTTNPFTSHPDDDDDDDKEDDDCLLQDDISTSSSSKPPTNPHSSSTLSPSFWNALAPDVTTRSRTRERKGTNISASLLLALAAPTVSTRSCVRAATDRVRARAAHLGKCTLHHTWVGGK